MKKSNPEHPDFVSYLVVEKFIRNELEESMIKKGIDPNNYDIYGMAENIMEYCLYPEIKEQIDTYRKEWRIKKGKIK